MSLLDKGLAGGGRDDGRGGTGGKKQKPMFG